MSARGAAATGVAAAAPPAATSEEIWGADSRFCPLCGTVLDMKDYGDVSCFQCPYRVALSAMRHEVTHTQSYPKPTPEWLAEWRIIEAAKRGEVEDIEAASAAATGRARAKRATVKEECPKCHHPQMEFYTMQLRSADEGQTVFYECCDKKCGYKYSVNT